MSWKNLKQRSLADSLLPAHNALTELDAVHDLVDWSEIESLLPEIHNKARGERA